MGLTGGHEKLRNRALGALKKDGFIGCGKNTVGSNRRLYGTTANSGVVVFQLTP
jgi:hypothetical protein